jgi:hypothetical protein
MLPRRFNLLRLIGCIPSTFGLSSPFGTKGFLAHNNQSSWVLRDELQADQDLTPNLVDEFIKSATY